MRDPFVVIGLTGGVGAGKSTVARMLEDLGCALFDADARARAVLEEPDVRAAIVSDWGEGVLNEEGQVDRAALGLIVFADDAQRRRLEGLVHPRVRASMRESIARARTEGRRAIVLDIPLLLEGGLDEICDVVVHVDAPEGRRDSNVKSRGWDADERARREAAQTPVAQKARRADVVIVNDGSLDELRERVEAALTAILTGADRGTTAGGDAGST